MLPEYVITIKKAVPEGFRWCAHHTKNRSQLLMPIGTRMKRWPRTAKGAKNAWHSYAKRKNITDWEFAVVIDGQCVVQTRLFAWPA